MATSPRLVAVLKIAEARRSRERRALRLLALPLLLAVIVSALTSAPHLATHGTGLVKALSLVALVGSFAVIRARGSRLDAGDESLAPTVGGLVVLALAAAALVYIQPSGAGALALSLVAYVCGARLPLRLGILLTAGATVAVVIAALLAESSPHTLSTSSSILLAVLLLVMARTYRRAEEDRLRAEVATAELEAARERELESAAVAERSRIARELHDVLAHSLSGLSLQLEGARLQAERETVSPELHEMLGRSRRLAAEGLEEAQRAVRTLRGEALPGIEDLERLVQDFGAGPLTVAYTVRGEPREVPSEAGLTLYRAAQEALTNVMRHSGAQNADVVLEFAPDQVKLTVADHAGADATPALAGFGSGYGLSAMRERAELLGGQVTSGPAGDGFRVEVALPV
ncbi:MAG TPA: sensor histidine kinase [Thermoleophilaceae bacterium]|jgi:signal transduction histidine kinase|nr:sensor histidine kinase [Thermoleophilaceae bacterium]